MKPTIETERLTLRPVNTGDGEALLKLLNNPAVNKYLWDPLYKSVDEVIKMFTIPEDCIDYAFVIVSKETGKLIGSCGIGPNSSKTEWDFGYSFLPECWNKGYATETLKALIKFAYGLGARDFCASFASDNAASGRVMEKCGMHFDHYDEFTKADKSATFKSKYYKLHLE